jgi:hypothetical protein
MYAYMEASTGQQDAVISFTKDFPRSPMMRPQTKTGNGYDLDTDTEDELPSLRTLLRPPKQPRQPARPVEVIDLTDSDDEVGASASLRVMVARTLTYPIGGAANLGPSTEHCSHAAGSDEVTLQEHAAMPMAATSLTCGDASISSRYINKFRH